MKTELPKNSKHIKNKLDLIKSKILSVAEDKIDKIILFGSYARGDWVKDMYMEGHITYSYESDLDILIILKKGKYSHTKAINMEYKIAKKLEEKQLERDPWVTIIIEPIGAVNEQLRIGQYFFSDIKKEGILIYDSGTHELSEPAELGKDEVRKIAQEDYDYWIYKGSTFLADSIRAFKREDYSFSAFYLHQSTESFYNTILLVFTGYKPKTHDIKKLKGMVNSYHEDLLKIFHFDTPEQTKCFELLRDAYVEARYNKNYKITEEQLSYLTTRVEKLKNVTEKICLAKIESYR
ncbi:MAG TPA: HEPN domain-containing protein [Candidatus Megaira endosymbiont of Nemacystus decipiens]|nr:HEPN domain-containing protein [Candidatus Megaera endosymbiont of Nemacystus decipiens]